MDNTDWGPAYAAATAGDAQKATRDLFVMMAHLEARLNRIENALHLPPMQRPELPSEKAARDRAEWVKLARGRGQIAY
jgi:hypothetical protein